MFFDVDNAVNSAVRKLRRALGDDSDAPRFVVTVPSKGYRFIADVCEESLAAANPPSSTQPAAAAPRKSDEPQIRQANRSAPENLEGERKTVTVLLVDFKGSTGLVENLDPEEARAIVDPALKLMVDAVQQYDGYVTRSTDDGIFAMFGAPVAHEDHPQRALSAALRMQAELKRYAEKLRADKGVEMQVRAGAHTGEVVVREIRTGEKHTEYGPIGNSTSVAAHLRMIAAPGSIAIAESMRKLVEGYFTLNLLGPARINGVGEALEIYEVTGAGPLRTRFQRAAARGYTKFVGRQREMETLKHAAELAQAGRGQIVATIAEPGLGKSRLLFEFKAGNQSGWMVLEAFSVSHGKATVYLPVIELLHGYFRITKDDDQRSRRERVNGKIVTLDPALEDTRPYLFGLLGLVEGADPLAQMDPQVRRRRTQDAIKRLLVRESLNQPVMLVFEDLQQIDDETQAFLNQLTDSIGTSRILLLVSYRPEYSHLWGSKTFYTQVRLDPLDKERADQMLTALLGSDEGVIPLKRLIEEKTEGNPLFIEEIYQALIEEGALVLNGAVRITRPLNALKIPATVQAILAARIDRLPVAEKQLVQTLAVIGKRFQLKLAAKVAGKSQQELIPALDKLQEREFIYEQPSLGDVEYEFKHALTQEVAYNSLLIERRKAEHERTAAAIESVYRANLDDHLSELTNHYGRSTNTRKTVEYLWRSGRQAALRSAYKEGLDYLTRGLELLRQLPDDSQRQGQELRLQRSLVECWTPLASVASPEMRSAMERIAYLSEQVGDRGEFFRALLNFCDSCLISVELSKAGEYAQRALTLAAAAPPALAWAHDSIGQVLQAQGDFASSQKELEKTLALAETTSPLISFGHRALFLTHLAHTLWLLGYPRQALDRAEQARALAKSEPDLWSRGICEFNALRVRLWLRDKQTVNDATRLLTFATEHGLSGLIFLARISLGIALAQHGQPAQGVAESELGLKEGVRMKMHWRQRSDALRADAYAKAGRYSEGLRLVAEALARSEETGEAIRRAEFYRLKGELLLAGNNTNVDEAERAFRAAIEVADQQAARSWELRATTSLARLLRDIGRPNEARKMLDEIYNWFTEGFDTADLKDAKALLAELSA